MKNQNDHFAALHLEPELPGRRRDSAPSGKRYVTFFVGGWRFAVAAEDVAEIVQSAPLTMVPNAPASLLGITLLRDRIGAVIDLHLLASCDRVGPAARSKTIVLRNAKMPLLFAVDKVAEIVEIADDKLTEPIGLQPFLDRLDAATGLSILSARSLRAALAHA